MVANPFKAIPKQAEASVIKPPHKTKVAQLSANCPAGDIPAIAFNGKTRNQFHFQNPFKHKSEHLCND